MRQLVLDAGPLYALFAAKDIYHHDSIKGFQELAETAVSLIAPVPIIFEVYKLLAQRDSIVVAQTVLQKMLLMDIRHLTPEDFKAVTTLNLTLRDWKGSLEDATVVWFTQKLNCPVWTLNYRDFSCFQHLSFWTPKR